MAAPLMTVKLGRMIMCAPGSNRQALGVIVFHRASWAPRENLKSTSRSGRSADPPRLGESEAVAIAAFPHQLVAFVRLHTRRPWRHEGSAATLNLS
jgi:hypothetical protein